MSSSEVSQRQLRKLIKDIRDDKSLSEDQKRLAMQGVMLTSSRTSTPNNEPADLQPKILEPNNNKTCDHYQKNCSKFYFSCCDTIEPCHRCHLERGCEIRPPQIATIGCNNCGTRQPPGPRCRNPSCNLLFSASHCQICMVWTQSQITHCDKCGTCRIGTPESIYHCDTCEACFFVAHKDKHRCVKSSMRDMRCPLCLEATYLSQKRCDILRCGHVVHFDCMNASLKHGEFGKVPRCPTCRKCLFPEEKMKPYWDSMREAIRQQPLIPIIHPGDEVISPDGPFLVERMFDLPTEPGQAKKNMCVGLLLSQKDALGNCPTTTFPTEILKKEKRVPILCYDCEGRSEAVFHYLGMECGNCSGYNTSRV